MTRIPRRLQKWATRITTAAVLAAVFPFSTATPANAAPVTIISYDITDSPASGSGGWTHFYTNPFVPTGVDPVQHGALGTYEGGSGTLNDGIISASTSATHLFFTGARAHPVITLHLAAATFIDTIEIYGGEVPFNIIPGALNQLTVRIADSSIAVVPQEFGPLNAIGTPVNDSVTLTGTELAGIPTDTVVLQGTAAAAITGDQFSITEIKIDGRPAADPPLTAGIDIGPGEKIAKISLHSDDPIVVAILSTATFNAVTAVNKGTLTFGRTGTEPSLNACGKPQDVNRDSRPDLVCSFNARLSGFRLGDAIGNLHGTTIQERLFEGKDSVKVVR